MTHTESLIEIQEQAQDIHLTEDQRRDLGFLVDTLHKWGRRINLTSDPDPSRVVSRQLPDALHLFNHLRTLSDLHLHTFADVGSGAGLPGLALALLLPAMQTTLVEANNKKCSFMRTVAHGLQRSDIRVLNQRVASAGISGFDVVSSRATWAPREWIRRAAPLLRDGGLAVVFSSKEMDESILVGQFIFHSRLSFKIDNGSLRYQTFFQLSR